MQRIVDRTRLADWYDDRDWHIVKATPMREPTLWARMIAAGIPARLPMVKKQFQRLNRPTFVDRALFPGYVFARLREGQDALIRGYPGFAGMLHTGDRFSPYAMVSADAVAALSEQEFELSTHKNIALGKGKYHEFRVGQRARLLDGPFRGLWGQIEAVEEDKRIILLLSLFGRPTPIDVRAGEIETAKS